MVGSHWNIFVFFFFVNYLASNCNTRFCDKSLVLLLSYACVSATQVPSSYEEDCKYQLRSLRVDTMYTKNGAIYHTVVGHDGGSCSFFQNFLAAFKMACDMPITTYVQMIFIA